MVAATGTVSAQEVFINEIYASHDGTDDREFVELVATPNMALDGYMVLVVDGDGATRGILDRVWDLAGYVVPADGYFVLGDAAVPEADHVVGNSNVIENGTEVFYLIETADPAFFSAASGSQVDADGNLVTDIAVHANTTIVDLVALVDDDYPQTDSVYDGALALGPDGASIPAGVFRSTDAPGAWCGATFLDADPDLNTDVERTPGGRNVDCNGDPANIGAIYCAPAALNSTGLAATIVALGSRVLADDDLRLECRELPPGRLGCCLVSRSSANVVNPGGSQGTLCLGAPLGFFAAQAQVSDAAGRFMIDVDLSMMATLGAAAAGETWYFQAWYRDLNPTRTTNFTDALSLTFQ